MLMFDAQKITASISIIIDEWWCFRWKSPDYDDHRKTACNLLVLILSDDESMKMLFADKNSSYCEKFRGEMSKQSHPG